MNIGILALVIAVFVVAATVILLPATSSTTLEVRFDAPVRAVWEVYTDFESQPNWRADVGQIEMADDNMTWTETLKSSGMTIRFHILEMTPPNKLVLKTGAQGNFEGRYVAEFIQQEGGTLGRFTEESTSLGMLPKVMRRIFFDQEAFIQEFAREAQAEIERRKSSEGPE